MKIKIVYEADVPEALVKNDFCDIFDRVKCPGLIQGFPYMECKRFSCVVEYWKGRYKKCQACADACATAIAERK